MDMIGHDDKTIHFDVVSNFGRLQSFIANNRSEFVQHHFPMQHVAEQT